MRSRPFVPWLIKFVVFAVAMILVLLPFHPTLTVVLSQFVGHYTILRLWKEMLLMLLVAGAGYIAITHPQARKQVFGSKLFWLMVAFITIQIVWGVAALVLHEVTLKALGYGWVVNTRFFIFFIVAWGAALVSPKLSRWWPYLVFIPGLVVIVFGLLQYFVLPYDFMKHLGYSNATIFPYEDINHNIHYIRIMSSLRGSNPLGAYLVLLMSLFAAWSTPHFVAAVKQRSYKRLAAIGLYAVAGLLALVLTFSRGAWLGLAASVPVLIWLLRPRISRQLLVAAAGMVGLIVVGLGIWTFAIRNPAIQNIVLHTQDHSAVASTSDQGHTSALQTGLQDLLHEPLGRGPGTAGPASEYNTGHPARLAENYIVQIGQETGWLGLLLFVDILWNVGSQLYQRRRQPLAIGLLAGLIGLTLVSLTSHAWTDDTLAYVFWGLAGVACALPLVGNKRLTD
jgi:hypothetical protein